MSSIRNVSAKVAIRKSISPSALSKVRENPYETGLSSKSPLSAPVPQVLRKDRGEYPISLPVSHAPMGHPATMKRPENPQGGLSVAQPTKIFRNRINNTLCSCFFCSLLLAKR
jgi:hypothetical protein